MAGKGNVNLEFGRGCVTFWGGGAGYDIVMPCYAVLYLHTPEQCMHRLWEVVFEFGRGLAAFWGEGIV
jgi:hypothetical protein